MDYKYFDCYCKCMDHVLRLVWDKEDNTLFFEAKVEKYPKSKFIGYEWKYEHNKPIKNLFIKINMRFTLLKEYFNCIWWAIKGRPYWWDICTEFSPDEMIKMRNYLDKCLKEIKNV